MSKDARGRRAVALVTPLYAPAIGGVEWHVEMLARGLVKQGVEVSVITTDPIGTLPNEEILDGVVVRRFRTGKRSGRFFLSASMGRWLARHAGDFALVHAHSYHTPVALQAAIAARASGVPFVITPHYHGTGHSPMMRVLHIPYRPLGTWMMRSATRIICVSEWERDLVVRHFLGRTRTSVIPNGVDVDQIQHARPFEVSPQEEIILSVGRLEGYKGADRLITALPHLPPGYRLVLVGEGPARSMLESLVTKLDVQGRVRFLGKVERSELDRWYRTAAVYVSFSAHEAFGLTLLEAAAAGTAVVASSIPAHREVAGYAPEGQIRLVDRTTEPGDLAQAISEAHRDATSWSPDLQRIPTWDGMARQVHIEYERLLGSPSVPR